MDDDKIMRNVRCMNEMFPAFIERYITAARTGRVDAWASAIHSVIDLVAIDHAKKSSAFSDFIRNASPSEKESVYTEVMAAAEHRQNLLLRQPPESVNSEREG